MEGAKRYLRLSYLIKMSSFKYNEFPVSKKIISSSRNSLHGVGYIAAGICEQTFKFELENTQNCLQLHSARCWKISSYCSRSLQVTVSHNETQNWQALLHETNISLQMFSTKKFQLTNNGFYPLKPIGNYTPHLLQQSVALHFVITSFVRFSL
jgi:hypothetical protein